MNLLSAARNEDSKTWTLAVLKRNKLITLSIPLVVFVFGAALRIWYCQTHTYLSFGHDAYAHVEHIKYVAATGHSPPPDAGWEFYQPPLYYWICGTLYRWGLSQGLNELQCLKGLEWMSCCMSIAMLACTARICTLVFRKGTWSAVLFTGIASALPGLVLFASQINNDVPAQVILFCGMMLLIEWWQRPETKRAFTFACLIGIGLLVKTNCILLAPLGLIALWCRSDLKQSAKIKLSALSAAVIMLISGWYVLPKAMSKSNIKDYVVSNHYRLPVQLQVETDATSLLLFNPVEIVKHPYNDSWSDESRRNYATEYLFRSAFFGEFNFGRKTLADAILISAMLALLAGGAKFMLIARKDLTRVFPLWLSTPFFYFALLGNRIIYPFAVCGDYRFIAPIILGCGAMIAYEDDTRVPAWLKWFARCAASSALALCTANVLQL